MKNTKIDWPEFVAAGVVVVFGLGFAATATRYPFGSLLRPGSGFVPMMVGGLIAALGAAVAVEARGQPRKERAFPVRPIAAVSAGVIVFALLVETAGFVPAAVALVLLSGLGEQRTSWLSLLGVAAFMSLFGVVLFIWGLGVPLRALSWTP